MTDEVVKQLGRVPRAIGRTLQKWVDDVSFFGLEEVRKRPGFHDEPLKGKRQGQRSIRLNRQWRAIYVIAGGHAQFVRIEELTPHDY